MGPNVMMEGEGELLHFTLFPSSLVAFLVLLCCDFRSGNLQTCYGAYYCVRRGFHSAPSFKDVTDTDSGAYIERQFSNGANSYGVMKIHCKQCVVEAIKKLTCPKSDSLHRGNNE
jgi:hypothetical protein